jgi:hypothetical protein
VLVPDRTLNAVIGFVIGLVVVMVVATRNSRPKQAGSSVTMIKKAVEKANT